MEFKVCDALCGAGKTVSCINMMNRNTDTKYIFITPYLDEVDRIRRDCASRDFESPERSYPRNKSEDIQRLIREGKNIASTHSLFSNFTDETKELIRTQNYVLVLDEVIDLFQEANLSRSDVTLLRETGVLSEGEHGTVWTKDNYEEGRYTDIKYLADSRNLVRYSNSFYFWAIPIDIFICFKDVYILTYMFEHQLLKHYFDTIGIHCQLIGTKKLNGTYEFCPLEEMDRRRDLRKLIHIVDHKKYNAIGDEPFSLSAAWFKRNSVKGNDDFIQTLKKYINSVYRYIFKARDGEKMWTTYGEYKSKLKGKGYTNGFVAFNMRATNDYVKRRYLAYCVNVYLQPWMKNYLIQCGANEINQDMYALSILIQWIFRSAIRKGEEIWIYIPSARMRYLLKTWIQNLSEGKDLENINYITAKRASNKNKGNVKK